ncbi:cell division protein FtsL [Thorsellia kenyensis]|uniref:Cell division protein FtsL n=1 Tax=Thorsellia kenyensis TaxID=1549888 RepID=A0ABV6CBQ6_9GAMM
MAKQPNLVKIIVKDIFKRSKLAMLFFILIILTVTFTILITNETRILRYALEQKEVEKKSLDLEWRNLILEEKNLGEQQRIEKIAQEVLKMTLITSENELILMVPAAQN